MGKVKILTPTHIGSGATYYVTHINDGYIYTLDDIVGLIDFTNPTSNIILNELKDKKSKNLSKKEFINKFYISHNDLKNIKSEKLIGKRTNPQIRGNVFEMTKTLEKLIIPGSSIKGYVLNVLHYDIILKNEKVRRYLLNEFEKVYDRNILNFLTAKKNNDKKGMNEIINEVNKKVSKTWRDLENKIKDIYSLIGFRDIEFSNVIEYYEIIRYGKKGKELPQGVFETIPVNSCFDGEVLIDNNIFSSKFIDKKVSEIERKRNVYNDDIAIELLKSIKERFNNFEKWFITANKDFIKQLLKYEEEFLSGLNNDDVDTLCLRQTFSKFKKLNEEKTIIQIGKATNFILKSISSSFGQSYKDMFELIFAPNVTDIKTLKKKPEISMMSLAVENEHGSYPLGFIEVEF